MKSFDGYDDYGRKFFSLTTNSNSVVDTVEAISLQLLGYVNLF